MIAFLLRENGLRADCKLLDATTAPAVKFKP
jgi:hypothetical protein